MAKRCAWLKPKILRMHISTLPVSGNTIVWQRGRGPNSNLYIFVYQPEAPVERVVTNIDVTPPTAILNIGETEPFSALARDQFGLKLAGVTFAWTSDDTTVGTIDDTGRFTAKAAGSATVTATADNVSGTATVTVNAEDPGEPVLDRIEVTPETPTLEIDGTQQFTATAFDQFEDEMINIAFSWSCDNETVGTIDNSTGLFTAKAEGTADVVATVGSVSGTATVTVTAEEPVAKSITVTPTATTLEIDETEQFEVIVRDQFGNAMTEIAVNWSCSNTTAGTIDESTGLFTALAAGTATVTASVGEVSGTATVTVNAEEPVGPEEPVLTRITVTPPTATLDTGELQRFMVTGYDQNDNVMPAGEIAWACNDGAVGTIDKNGYFTALTAGTATVTATAGNCSAEATITVNECPALAKIAVSPSAATLEVGDELEFSAIAFDRFGDIVEDAGITWECSDSCVGMIDECGVFTALAEGTATVTACGDGAEGTATVTVNCDEPVLTCIVITPSAITLAKGDTAAFTATALDQDGCEMTSVVIDWACSDSCVGTIDLCSGFFSALDCGTATVTATADGVTATAEIEVTDESAGVVVSPSSIILDPGDEWQFTATVYDPQDNASEPTITWSCDDEGVGTITSDGLFTAVCEGSTPVTASADGINETLIGTATVTVRSASPELARIVVSPSDFTIAAGNSLTLTAFDRHGCPIEDGVTWESSDPCVGTVDECGTFTAIEAGAVTLTASANGVCDSACVTVLPSLPVPTCIEVEPVTVTMQTGETRVFTATVFDQCDNVMDCVEVTWSCSDPEVGTIDATGFFVASGTGTTAVTASAGCAAAIAAVTVTAAPTPEPTTPVSAGSGDSGGDSSPTFDAGMHENLAAGQTFTFSSTTSSVGSVSITAANTIPKLMLTVKKATPSAAEPPAGDIYEYVEITLNWANPDDIDNATIEFTIPAAWLEDHDMTPEDVRFMRCVNGAWQTLDTVVLGEENGLYRFRATTPGFSTFAIAAAPRDVTAQAEELNVTTEVTGTPEATGNVTTEPTEAVPATTPAAPLVYAPFLAPLAFLLWARKNH